MANTTATANQIPDHAILDHFNKQCYLGNAFSCSTGLISLADTAEHAFLYLANSLTPGASGSGQAIFQNLRKLICNDVTAAIGIVYRIYANVTSVSAGTTLTPSNLRLASATTSIATAKKSPTWTPAGTPILTLPVGWATQNLDEILLVIDPGKNIMLTAQATAAVNGLANLAWYEL